MPHDTFRVGDLTAVIGDNEPSGEHRRGYNGVWSLRHARCPRSLFVPTYAGLNLEHIFDGATDDRRPEVFFEPRSAPMAFRRLGPDRAELHQPATPVFHLESRTVFTLRPPHVLDMEFRFSPRQHAFQQGWIGLFWASYIHAPEDKSVYFWGGTEGSSPSWQQLCTQFHNDQSTVVSRGDRTTLVFRPDNQPSLFRSLSRLRFDLPLFYGHFEEMVWIVMFDRANGIRLTHSPSGGGFDAERQTTNPAWDFQFILPRYEVMQWYGFRVRTLFRPRCPREEILRAYREWSGGVRA